MCLEDKIYYSKLNYNLTRIQSLRSFSHLFLLRSSTGDKIMQILIYKNISIYFASNKMPPVFCAKNYVQTNFLHSHY